MKGKKIVVSRYGYTPVTITINDANALPMEDLKTFLWENILCTIAISMVDIEK